MKTNKLFLGYMSVILLTLVACKKSEQFYKDELFGIKLTGYNGSGETLVTKLGDVTFPDGISPNARFEQNNAYLFKSTENKIKLSVTEQVSGKLVLEKELNKEEGSAKLNFLYLDGKIGPMPDKPAVEKDKISLVYMFQPTVTNYTEPVDFVIGKYYVTPQVFEELGRLKNVKPYEFSTPVSIPTFNGGRQDYNGVMTSVSFHVRIYKAGTNIPYVDGTSFTWNVLNSNAPKPASSTASSKLYIFSESPMGNVMRFSTRLEL
ncbi:hypothetical protein [Pedobacter nyackensis]|uniref:hypothetical protein n=1 Tax=Pedobacter nyackensis TaxID=475255 RepID=UPI00292F30D6|nr:hypothetical protein [Pedobacter nyackensis]